MHKANMGLGHSACILICPECKHEVPAYKDTFIMADLDKYVACGTCHKRSQSKTGMCKCRKLWHICDKHAKASVPISAVAAFRAPLAVGIDAMLLVEDVD